MAPPEPTVAETGAPILGTGGPSSGTLSPRRGSIRRPSDATSTLSGSSFATAHEQEPIPAGAAPQSAIPPLSMPGTFDPAGWGSSSSTSDVHLGEQHDERGRNDELPAYGEGDDEARRAKEQAEAILAQERESKAGGSSGGGFA